MRKSTIFISTILTTFALVMLYSVVSAYRSTSTVTEAAALAADTATAEPTADTEPTAESTATPTSVTPEEAAQLAAQVVGNSNLLSAESSVINNLAAYKITFTNNDVVYVGLDGQILGVQIAPVVVNVAAPAKNRNKNSDDSNSAASNNGGETENHEDEHEEDDD